MRRGENQMNKVNSEQILESFLSEYLDDSTPQKINVVELQTRAIDPQTAIRFDAASKAAKKGWTGSTSRHPVIAAHHPRRVKLRTPSLWTKSLYLLSGVAAGVLLAFGSWSFLKHEKGSGLINSHQTLANLELDLLKDEQPKAVNNEVVAEASPATGNTELLSMDSVPFPTKIQKDSNNTDRSIVSDISKKPSMSDGSVVLNSDQLVSLVDDQMEYMWKLRGVNPSTAITDEQWLQRASLTVLGKPVSSEDQEKFLSDTSATRRENWLDRATQSDEFFQHWSIKFAGAILPKSESTESSDSLADRARFKAWLQNRLQASIPLNEIVNEILVAQGSLVANASDHSPQAYWWAQVAANDDHSRATNAITSNLLGQRGSCIRCHDSNAGSKQSLSNSLTSNDRSNQPSVSRDDYWNLASVVSGISVSGKKGANANANKSKDPRVVAANQEQKSTSRTVGYAEDWHTLFYERLDRSLIAAKTKLPNGIDLTAPSEKRPTSKDAIRKNIGQLANWITSAPTFDQRQVNWVWESMLGQPLQNRYLIVDSEGLVEKQELLEVLGAQLRGSQFNLAKLVKAIALTNTFQLESQSCDPVWYITSTPQELAEYQQRQQLFASFPATMDPSFRSLKNVTTWFRKSHSSVLGQPSFDPIKLPKSKDGVKPESVAPEVTPAQTEFIVRSRVLPKGLVTEVEQWLKSSMPWEDLVDHAFYLADDAPATKLEQMSARELLNSTRDRRQAIQRILASQLP